MDYNKVNDVLTKVEKGFNFTNSLPFVSVYTSPFRAKLGVIQAIFGAAIGLGVSIAIKIESLKSRPDQVKQRKFYRLQEYSFHQMKHGMLNFFRGLAETIVAVPTCGMLNAFTFLPLNLTQTPEFSPIKGYKTPSLQAVHA